MKLSYSKLEMFLTEYKEGQQAEYGDDKVAERLSIDSTEHGNGAFLDICKWDEDLERELHVGIDSLQAKQLANFLLSHIE